MLSVAYFPIQQRMPQYFEKIVYVEFGASSYSISSLLYEGLKNIMTENIRIGVLEQLFLNKIIEKDEICCIFLANEPVKKTVIPAILNF